MRYKSTLLLVSVVILSVPTFILLVDLDLLINDARRDFNFTSANLNSSLTSIASASRNLSDAGAEAALAAKEQRAYWSKTSLEMYKTMAAARLTIVRTDHTLNDVIAPKLASNLDHTNELTVTATRRLNATMDELSPSLVNLSSASASAADVMSDPAIHDSISNVARTTDNLAGTTADVHTETSLLVAKTREALTPESKWKSFAKAILGNSVTVVELWYYFTH